MALNAADREKLWRRADNRCSICKRRVHESPTPGARDAVGAVEHPIRADHLGPSEGLSLTRGYLDSYENHILLCVDDLELVRLQRAHFPPRKLEWLKAVHEERPEVDVTVTVHTAVFVPTSPPHYFIKVRNWSTDQARQLNQVWFATAPAVRVDNEARPLPTMISPGDLFETWIPVSQVPMAPEIEYLARAEFEDGSIVPSEPNRTMSPSGIVGGTGTPLTSLIASVAAANRANGQLIPKEWDVFISHSSKDKSELVEPLAQALRDRGLRVWYDAFEMSIGDSLRRKIDQGIASSAFGVVVLSPSFFTKPWTNYELDGLITRAVSGGQIILPIWHNVSLAEVEAYSPSLADKVACDTSKSTTEEIADLINNVVTKATRA